MSKNGAAPKADFFLSKYTLVSIPANYNNLYLPGRASEQYQFCLFGVLRDAITGAFVSTAHSLAEMARCRKATRPFYWHSQAYPSASAPSPWIATSPTTPSMTPAKRSRLGPSLLTKPLQHGVWGLSNRVNEQQTPYCP